jgi:hypothetical protein
MKIQTKCSKCINQDNDGSCKLLIPQIRDTFISSDGYCWLKETEKTPKNTRENVCLIAITLDYHDYDSLSKYVELLGEIYTEIRIIGLKENAHITKKEIHDLVSKNSNVSYTYVDTSEWPEIEYPQMRMALEHHATISRKINPYINWYHFTDISKPHRTALLLDAFGSSSKWEQFVAGTDTDSYLFAAPAFHELHGHVSGHVLGKLTHYDNWDEQCIKIEEYASLPPTTTKESTLETTWEQSSGKQ